MYIPEVEKSEERFVEESVGEEGENLYFFIVFYRKSWRKRKWWKSWQECLWWRDGGEELVREGKCKLCYLTFNDKRGREREGKFNRWNINDTFKVFF